MDGWGKAAVLTPEQPPSWRADRPVLVSDTETLGAIAVVRSLGRAGYPAHACSTDSNALGLRSRYGRMRVVCPAYQSPLFIPWLREYVRRHEIKALVPSENLLLHLRPHFEEFALLLPFSSVERVLYAGLSKHDLFNSLMREGAFQLAPALLVDRDGNLPSLDALRALGLPLYVKADACYADDQAVSTVRKCESAEEAQQQLSQLLCSYATAIVQGHVPGKGVGVFALRWRGQLLAEFMHRRLHEVPHTGGVSSLRESWWHPRIRDEALAILEHLDWEGVAMLEYRYDEQHDTFSLIEMNGRFWGSLHLALYAGVDFPRLLLDAHQGNLDPRPPSFERGIRCRHTLPAELQHTWSALRDTNLPADRRLGAVTEFVRLSLDPTMHSDLAFPGDRGLYWRNFSRVCSDYTRLLMRSHQSNS